MLPKPAGCIGCTLERRGLGFSPAVGPPSSPILFVAEALGKDEAIQGLPLVGQAGGMFNRVLWRSHYKRDDYRLHNVVNCRPPNNWLLGAPWQASAISHCKAAYLDHTLAEGHTVVVAMGKTAIITLLGLEEYQRDIRVEDFHGRVIRDPTDRFWVIPTFHPSHLQRGARNLFGVVTFAVDLAHEIARDGYEPEKDASLVIDPPVEWFEGWANNVLAEFSAAPNPWEAPWLFTDIETPDKERQTDEGELGAKDRSWQITRVNFSVHPDEGITVPFFGPYITIIKRLMRSLIIKCFWFDRYDVPRLDHNDCEVLGPILDGMWMFHVLQSDIPRGLGFASCHYSKYPPWKYLSGYEPQKYAAIDGLQTNRTVRGTVADLIAQGMWEVYYRHIYLMDTYCFRPAEKIGLPISLPKLEVFRAKLEALRVKLFAEIQTCVPDEVRPLYASNKDEGWKKRPETVLHDGVECVQVSTLDKITKVTTLSFRPLITVTKTTMVLVCEGCGEQEVVKKHRCKDHSLTPQVRLADREVTRYFRRDPFNPLSSQQKLDYAHFRGHKPGRQKKDRGKESMDKESIKKLLQSHPEDPIYRLLQQISQVSTVKGTYADGTIRRLREDPRSIKDHRIHCTITHRPSTLRVSVVNPNLNNVVADKSGSDAPAAGFRDCVVASPGCVFLEPDFSAIESVTTGWFSEDPNYIRLAKLGIHGYIASHLPAINKPPSLSWSDADLAAYFADIKKEHRESYEQAKRTVHAVSYGQTAQGTLATYPDVFKNMKAVQVVREVFFSVAPKLKAWQRRVQDLAHEQGFLGGPGQHPFAYRHWYYDVYNYRQIPKRVYDKRLKAGLPVSIMFSRHYAIDFGEDAKRAVSFFPQSSAAGIQYEASLKMFKPDESPEHYIGDLYFGQTPLRASIYDSNLMEVEERHLDRAIERAYSAMTGPVIQMPCPPEWNLGPYLTVGVEVKVGHDWGHMEKVKVSSPGVASDMLLPEVQGGAEDEEDEYEITKDGGPASSYSGSPSSSTFTHISDDDVPF